MFLDRMMRFFNGFPVVSAPKSMKEVKIDFRAGRGNRLDTSVRNNVCLCQVLAEVSWQ